MKRLLKILVWIIIILIIFFETILLIKMYQKNDEPKTMDYSQLFQEVTVLNPDKSLLAKTKRIYILDDKDICVSQIIITKYFSDYGEENYLSHKTSFKDSNTEDIIEKYYFDDEEYTITEIIKTKYDEENNKELIMSNIEKSDEYIIADTKIF